MSEETLQLQIDELKKKLDKFTKDLSVPDHEHSGIDVNKIRFKNIEGIFTKQVTINPGSLADGVGATIQITNIKGATLGDFVAVAAPYDLQDITVTAYVQATGIVEIRIQNESGSIIDLASGIWRILIIRKVI